MMVNLQGKTSLSPRYSLHYDLRYRIKFDVDLKRALNLVLTNNNCSTQIRLNLRDRN